MRSPPTIYLDYNATTPLDAAVRAVLIEGLTQPWGNPSSVHHLGRVARAALDDARDRVAALFQCRPSEIVFTSGGTEANNLAVLGAARVRRDRGRHLVCSPTEHPAVLSAHEFLARHEGFELTYLPVDSDGLVAPDDVARVLRPDTVLVSVMTANNETGVVQPFAAIGRLCRSRGILFHTDAVQGFGKLPFQNIAEFEADLVPLCAHKFHGPKGIGLLYCRSPLLLAPMMMGGSQEMDRRAGTENLPLILALVRAMEAFLRSPVFPPELLTLLSGRIRSHLASLPGIQVLGGSAPVLANTVSFTVTGSDSIAVLAALDLAGICASSGSACSSGSVEPSHVLRAMGLPAPQAGSLVRFSLGRETTTEDIDRVMAVLPGLLAQVRSGP